MELSVDEVYAAFEKAGEPIANVGLSRDQIHVDASIPPAQLIAAMNAIGLIDVSAEAHGTRWGVTRGYFYPSDLEKLLRPDGRRVEERKELETSMRKLHFTKQHAGWFIYLTFIGVVLGLLGIRWGWEDLIKFALILFAFAGGLALLLTAINWIDGK